MTRNVYPNGMVAHLWAHQSQPEARSGNGNLWFDGATLYSYRTPIARIVQGARGQRVALITTDNYSITTSGHKHRAWIATDWGRSIPAFAVPDLGTEFRFSVRGDCPPEHAANLAHLVDGYTREVARCRRARELWQTNLAAHLDNNYAKPPADYAEAFGLPDPALDPEQDAADVLAYRAEREARLNTPEAIAKRERERERREARKEAKRAAELAARAEQALAAYRAWRDGTREYRPHAWQLPAGPEREEAEAREAAELAQQHRDAAEAFRAWREDGAPRPPARRFNSADADHRAMRAAIEQSEREERDARELARRDVWLAGGVSSWRGTDADGGALLRVRGDTLQTSLGAEVPLDHAVRAFRFIAARRAVGEAWQRNGPRWQRNGHTLHVGHFSVDSITAGGDIRAGCHTVHWPEIERIARELGVFGEVPAC